MKIEDLLPTKTLNELMNTATESLKSQSFRVTNFRPGAVFITLLNMALQGIADLQKLFPTVLKQLFLVNAKGGWLDLKAYDTTRVRRKPTVATEGNFIYSRATGGTLITIPAGAVVKAIFDTKELRFIVKETTNLPSQDLSILVPIHAEQPGEAWNIGGGSTIQMVTHIPGIDEVTNATDWISTEGADVESDESLRKRAINRWEELAGGGSEVAYQSRAESVPGVTSAIVDAQHPRGDGTVDIIITSPTGIPTTELVNTTQVEIDQFKSLVADVLVKAPEAVTVDATVTLYIDPNYGDAAVIESRARAIWSDMFKTSLEPDPEYPNVIRAIQGYSLDRSLIITNLRRISYVLNVVLDIPTTDVSVNKNQLAVEGLLTLTIENAVIS